MHTRTIAETTKPKSSSFILFKHFQLRIVREVPSPNANIVATSFGLQLLWTLDIIFKVCKNFVSTSFILESRNVSNLCQCPRETQRLHLRDKAFVLALIMPASERTRETLRGETETGSYINLSELHCALAHRFALKLTACPGRSWFLKFFCRSFTTLSTREWSLVCLHF